MKRKTIRLMTMGMACGMMLWSCPLPEMYAMEAQGAPAGYPEGRAVEAETVAEVTETDTETETAAEVTGTAIKTMEGNTETLAEDAGSMPDDIGGMADGQQPAAEPEEQEAFQIEGDRKRKVEQGKYALEQLAAEREIIATLYRTDYYPLSAAAGHAESGIAKIPSGAQVMIEGVELQDGVLWYLVDYCMKEQHYRGYVQEDYLISTDSRFLDWQQSYLAEGLPEVGLGPEGAARTEDIQAFPESYRSYLYQLKSRHPNWVFVPMNTDLEWRTVIAEEMKQDRSWVHSSKGDAWKGEQRDDNWYLATREAVEYCVDPRNFLNEQYIFMFEQLTYNGQYHTRQGVQSIIQNTFMRGEIPDPDPSKGEERITYADHFYRVGQSLGVSPFHLAARVYQEQGVNGTSSLISGTYPGYEGYYNYYNISASGTSDKEVIESGLKYARSRGWDTRQRSIQGGAGFISQNYILKGQDTLYLQKFDVDDSYNGMFYHQYMQNLTAPMTEGATTRAAYERVGALSNGFVFKIPVYRNMPASPCPEPGKAQGINPTPDEEQLLRDFIIRLYVNALGRKTYEEEEVDYWYDRLTSGKSDGASLAYGFFFSGEFKEKNLSDGDYVDLLYQVMFNRNADPEGKSQWTERLAIGMSREYIYAGFANSTEFAVLCQKYGVKQGVIRSEAYRDQNEGVTAFVSRLYNKALGRGGDEQGLEDWCRMILRREGTMESVAYGFIFSPEFLSHNTTNEMFVRILYRTFLDREGDPAGFADWVGKLDQGMDREFVFQGFARSREFSQLMEEYGIAPY